MMFREQKAVTTETTVTTDYLLCDQEQMKRAAEKRVSGGFASEFKIIFVESKTYMIHYGAQPATLVHVHVWKQ